MMLRPIFQFFKKEPKYFWIFLAALAFYGFAMLGPRSGPSVSQHSKSAADFRQAEEAWSRDMDREGAFREFAKRQPLFASLFGILTLFFMGAFLAGFLIDALWIWRPASFEKWKTDLSPPRTQGWSFSMLFKVVLLFVVYGIVLGLFIGTLQVTFPGWISDNHAMILHTLVLNLIGLSLIVRFIKRAGGTWQDLGFRVPMNGFFREVKAGFLGYLGVLPVFAAMLVGLLWVANFFHYEPPPHPLVNVFLEEGKRVSFLVVISLGLGTVAGPVFEEIFFRGFCYPILRNRWGKVWGMGLSAAFFAGIHHSGFVFWPVFILGIALAFLYEKRRSLVASITLHITHNTLFIGYFFLVKQILAR